MTDRATIEEITSTLFHALHDLLDGDHAKDYVSMTEIAQHANLTYKTTVKYINLIKEIQTAPPIHTEVIGRSEKVSWDTTLKSLSEEIQTKLSSFKTGSHPKKSLSELMDILRDVINLLELENN